MTCFVDLCENCPGFFRIEKTLLYCIERVFVAGFFFFVYKKRINRNKIAVIFPRGIAKTWDKRFFSSYNHFHPDHAYIRALISSFNLRG